MEKLKKKNFMAQCHEEVIKSSSIDDCFYMKKEKKSSKLDQKTG